MERRFYDAEIITSQAYRKLTASLKSVYFYLWAKCDKSGVYKVDEDYFKIDTGEKFSHDNLKKLEPIGLIRLSETQYFFLNFIEVTAVGEIKEGYNPHKPIFRDIEKNNLSSILEFVREDEKGNKVFKINISSLDQASVKLVYEYEYVNEYKEEKKGGAGGKQTEEVKPHIFRDNEFFPIELFKANIGDKYHFANLDYYHEAVTVWSDKTKHEKKKWKTNWLAVARGFIMKDKQDGKLQLAKGQPTETQQVQISAIEKAMEGLQQYGRRK